MRDITNPPNPGIPYGIGELVFSHDALMRFAGALRLAVTGKPFDHLDRKVLVDIDFQSDRLGLAPGLHLAVEFTSAEARSVARALLRAADETEAPKRAASPLYC